MVEVLSNREVIEVCKGAGLRPVPGWGTLAWTDESGRWEVLVSLSGAVQFHDRDARPSLVGAPVYVRDAAMLDGVVRGLSDHRVMGDCLGRRTPCPACDAAYMVWVDALLDLGCVEVSAAHTGGGCMALEGRRGDLWVVVTDDLNLPMVGRCEVGIYRHNEDYGGWGDDAALAGGWGTVADLVTFVRDAEEVAR